jgi:hypothetical protein
MNTLANLWSVVTSLLDDGFSVIPIRDKDEIVNDKTFTKKSPFTRWEKYQKVRATKEELYFMLEKYNTLAIATICGMVSGNLEGIDVDSKWLPEIVKPLFDAIKKAFPEIKFRIIRTPSKGYHIVYRISDGVVPPNKKLAGRYSTDEELKDNSKGKVKYFIETRGENGYLAACPTEGYEVVVDVAPPVITWQQRCDLIAICESFNQIVKKDVYKPTKQENIYYSENPFEHFNNSNAAEDVLLNNGWKRHSENSIAIYFTRPGSKSGGIHAAFLLKTKLYKFFTSNCEFENEGRLYNAASVKAILEFGGDKKRLFPALVKDGYGKIAANKEYELVKKAAITGKELPANVSETAKEVLKEKKEIIQINMPYGIFWEYNDKGQVIINRENLNTVADGLGFRFYNGELLQIVDKFIYKRTNRYFFDAIKEYVKDEAPIEIYNTWSAFFEKHGKFTVEYLPLLNESLLLKDDRNVCYKFFSNGFVKITKEEKLLLDYEQLTGLVFYSRVQQRDFRFGNIASKYVDYLTLACRYNEKEKYLQKIIGYLSHEYKDETTGYIIVQVEECPDPKQGGGSGKNLFVKLLSSTTTVCEKSGSQVKFNEQFLQSWNGEKIFNLSDVPEKFQFEFLKEMTTGTGTLKKLYKDEVNIDCSSMCKFVVGTNYSYETKDGGLRRRIIPIEFTEFFTKAGGIDIHYGGKFPDIWTEEDWVGYDNFIVNGVQEWISCGLKLEPFGLSDGGFVKQFEQNHKPYALEFIERYFVEWVNDVKVPNGKFQTQWEEYCKEAGHDFKLPVKKINAAINEYCKNKGYDFFNDISIRDELNNIIKCRKFLQCEAPF